MNKNAMGLKITNNPLHKLLGECYKRPHSLCTLQRRNYAQEASSFERDASLDVAVLGGGITGLASAYLISQYRPNARITLYESQKRLGGWMQSSDIEVEGGRIIFEHGPRNLRPSGASGMATLDLIRRLGLEDDTLTTPKTSDAARKRYVYFPDHLVRMPGPGTTLDALLQSVLTEPIWKGIPMGALTEFLRPPRPSDLEDESIGSFLRRRFSAPLADNIVSAVLHGIYAGDIDRLSVKSLLPMMWHLEKDAGSFTRGALTHVWYKRVLIPQRDLDFMESLSTDWLDKTGRIHEHLKKFQRIIHSSVYTFRAGLDQLSSALEDELNANPNVVIKCGAHVSHIQSLSSATENKLEIVLDSHSDLDEASDHKNETRKASTHHRVISALPDVPVFVPSSKDAGQVAMFRAHPEAKNGISKPKQTDMVTVMVVNLYFPDSSLLPVRGFGYLIPRSIPFAMNPERALGVVFDSDATQGQDSASGTKLTVMLGGHWWNDWTSYPDEHEAVKMARAVLDRHLGITNEPTAWKATLQRDCIPQYHVGHTKRLQSEHAKLLASFGGRLTVAGARFDGVAVNDCVRSAYAVARSVRDGRLITGLEQKNESYGFNPMTFA